MFARSCALPGDVHRCLSQGTLSLTGYPFRRSVWLDDGIAQAVRGDENSAMTSWVETSIPLAVLICFRNKSASVLSK